MGRAIFVIWGRFAVPPTDEDPFAGGWLGSILAFKV